MVRRYADLHASRNKYDLIFPTSTGPLANAGELAKSGVCCGVPGGWFGGALRKLNGEVIEKPKYVPYDLRHFYASVLIANRKDPKTIQTSHGS